MSISRKELLEMQVQDNAYTRTFDFNTEVESGFTQAVTHGLAASVLSGAVGIVNTGIAAANMFGSDMKQFKTEEILKSWDWNDTYDYYLDNKEVVDAVGFAVSTLVPGAIGWKAAKFAQAAARVSESKNLLAVGLRTALVPESLASKVGAQIMTDTMHVANRSTILRMSAKQGIHQAAVETAFAETAILLTTNQHVTVNNNQLGYMEAMWEQKEGFLLGFGIGTGIGGLVNGAVIARSVNSLVDTAQQSTNKLFKEMTNLDSRTNRVGFVQGNKVAQLAAVQKKSSEQFADLAGADLAEFNRRGKELYDDLFEEVAVLTDEVTKSKTATGRRVVDGHLTPAIMELIERGNSEQVAATFRNSNRVGRYDDHDFLFDPAAQPLDIADDIGEFADMAGFAQFGDKYTKAKAATRPTKEQQRILSIAQEDASSARGLSIATGNDRFRNNIINRELIETGKPLSTLDPNHLIGTIRHELGHGNTVFLKSLFRHQDFGTYRAEMEALSRRQRPSSWAVVDSNKKAIEALLAKPSRSLDEIQDLARMQKWNDYMDDPMELMADSWAQFNAKDPLARKMANELAAGTRTLFEQNAAVKTRLGKSERLLALKSGKMYDESQWAPTVADRGTPKLSGKTVTAGNIGVKIDEANFSILNTTPDEASAYYFAASQMKTKMGKELSVNWDNFYQLNRIQHGLREGTWAGKVAVKLENGTTKILDAALTDNLLGDFNKLYTDLKASAATKLNKRELNRRNNTSGEIGRIIDTDEDFALSNGADTDSTRFWSMDNDPTKPTVAKVFYQTAADESGAQTTALADVISQNMKVLEVNEESINAFFGELDKLTGDGITHSKLNSIAPEPSWIVGQGSDMTDITRHMQLTGAFKTFAAEYGESTSKIQAMAKYNELAKLKGDEVIQRTMLNVAQKLSADSAAIMELNVLDSRLRQQFFKFTPRLASTDEAVQYLSAVATKVPPEQAQKNIARLFDSTAGKSLLSAMTKEKNIWTRDIEALVGKIVNQQKFQQTNLDKLELMISKDIVEIQNRTVFDFWRSKVQVNKMIVDGKKVAAGARGFGSSLDEGVLYPGGLDVTKFKHRKYVVPLNAEVWSHNQKGIIGAATPQELAQKEAQVLQEFAGKVKIVSKEDMESHFAKTGEYFEDFTLSEFRSNSDLTRKGINWDVAPEPNENLVAHYIRDMSRDWRGTVDNLTELKYSEEFASLQQLDGVSQAYGTRGVGQQEIVDTSFREAQNIILNRTTRESSKAWRDGQQSLDKIMTTAFGGLTAVFRAAAKTGDYAEMTKYLDHYGLPKVYGEQTGQMLRTSVAMTDQAFAELVPKVNGIAATLMLRLDLIQPMINALSMPIMSVPEMDVLMKSIPMIKAQQVAKGLHVKVPNTEFGMGTNMKLQLQAVKDFWGPNGKELLKRYYDEGIITNVVREMRQVADDVTIDATMDIGSITSKVNNASSRLVNKLAVVSDFAEDFVKFVAARQADLLLDAAGITDKSIRSATLRTYTTRVHGNYVQAQRPALFQGFAGQAIGLFQTYQFNLIQSLLSKIGDKNKVAVGAMVGIQAGMFGVQSVPGFRALNEYVALNSDEDNDFFTGLGETLGNDESEWILFGLASNFTKPVFGEGMELYTRGDLNPRTSILIPTSLDEVPAWSLSTKFVGNILSAAKSLSQGVDAGQVMANALAHNGVYRPLAGVGAILAGNRTTSNGSLITDLSDISWFAKAARTLGTKTLDESIAVQSFYRTKGYDTIRQDKLQTLGKSVKLMVQSGNFDEGAYQGFVTDFAASGGRPEQFNPWMHSQAIGATESVISKMYQSNDSRSGRYLQKVMGNDIDTYIDPQL